MGAPEVDPRGYRAGLPGFLPIARRALLFGLSAFVVLSAGVRRRSHGRILRVPAGFLFQLRDLSGHHVVCIFERQDLPANHSVLCSQRSILCCHFFISRIPVSDHSTDHSTDHSKDHSKGSAGPAKEMTYRNAKPALYQHGRHITGIAWQNDAIWLQSFML